MDLPSLPSGLTLPEEVSTAIAEPVQHAASADRADTAGRADALFASIVLSEFSKRGSPAAPNDEKPSCS